MSNRNRKSTDDLADPGFLEIVGGLTVLLGLAEQLQKLFPLDRMRMQKRHRRIEAQREKCADALTKARTALTFLQVFAQRHMVQAPAGTFGVAVPADELAVYREALGQLQKAIHGITAATYELQALTRELPSDHERYFQLSEDGRRVLGTISQYLHQMSNSDERPYVVISDLISEVESVLQKAWAALNRVQD